MQRPQLPQDFSVIDQKVIAKFPKGPSNTGGLKELAAVPASA